MDYLVRLLMTPWKGAIWVRRVADMSGQARAARVTGRSDRSETFRRWDVSHTSAYGVPSKKVCLWCMARNGGIPHDSACEAHLSRKGKGSCGWAWGYRIWDSEGRGYRRARAAQCYNTRLCRFGYAVCHYLGTMAYLDVLSH